MLEVVEKGCFDPFVAVAVAIFVRWSVSINSYSGFGKPPMFGDYEAQRHWMEITGNLPVDAWYRNSTENDLLYWGLDYPPLTAYHSLVNGKVAEFINGSWNALHTSRGLEDEGHKIFMRSTVILCDLLIYIPLLAAFFYKNESFTRGFEPKSVFCAFLCALLDPGLILIDHGHFQYNNVSLGLALWAVYAIFRQRPFVASALFCFALNYKQMELYHSVPFFVFLLKQCSHQKNIASKCFMLVKLGFVVVFSFLLVWAPFLLFSDKDGMLQVVRRIFPFNRGLFEDKVANVWCSLQPILRLKEVVNQEPVVKLCLATTVLSFLPDCYFLWRRATPKNLLVCLVSTSLSFFLFSYHVHEKSILLATAPASLLLSHHPQILGWFIVIASGSMLPLLHKDTLTPPTISLVLLFHIVLHVLIYQLRGEKENIFVEDDNPVEEIPAVSFGNTIQISASVVSIIAAASIVGMVFLCGLHLGVTPPTRYPDLFTYFIAAYSCAHFILFKICLLTFMVEDKSLNKRC